MKKASTAVKLPTPNATPACSAMARHGQEQPQYAHPRLPLRDGVNWDGWEAQSQRRLLTATVAIPQSAERARRRESC